MKPSKVLIIGSGPIIIGQACCHSEGAERLKNLGVGSGKKSPAPRPFASLRVTEESESNRESERGEAPLPNHPPLL